MNNENESTPACDAAREMDKKKKGKMKEYYDKKHSAKPSQLKIGDTVTVQNPRTNKLSSTYDPQPYTISDIKG